MRLLAIGRGGDQIGIAIEMATAQGVTLRRVSTIDAALEQLRAGQGTDLVLIDVTMDIARLTKALAVEGIVMPVVAYGPANDVRTAVAAVEAGAGEFLPSPPDPELIAAILAAVGNEHRELVFADPAMREVLALARQIAPSEASVLITGESGTGKEVLARYVHRHSRRAERAFVSVNCAAIPENLLESELFGHEKGAFTGATTRRIGKFEEASGGTLLLDEISEMDPRLQAKMLRAIQEREIDRVGGGRPVKVDIRLLATSNRNLEAEVAAGRLREDLWFRLNVIGLHLAPLRERLGDLAPLCNHFAVKCARANGLPVRKIGAAALARLRQHPWRGNVRELENCIHRAVLLATGEEIGAEAILLQSAERTGSDAGGAAMPLVGRTVAEVERRLILETLRHTLGNRTHAATILGISIRTLRNRLRQYGDEGVPIPAPVGGEFERRIA